MRPLPSKPWAASLGWAAAIPLAGYLALITIVAVRCGFGDAIVFAVIGTIALGIAAAGSVSVAAICLACRRGNFSAERVRLVGAILAVAAAVTGAVTGLQGLGVENYCDITM